MSRAPIIRKPVNPDGDVCDISIKDKSADNSVEIVHEGELNMPETKKEKGSQQQNIADKENTISVMNVKHNKREKASYEASPLPHNSDDEVFLDEEALDDRSKEQGKF